MLAQGPKEGEAGDMVDPATKAKAAIAELTGRDIQEGLVCGPVPGSASPDREFRAHIPGTGETFLIRERDSRVVRWDFGALEPDVGAAFEPYAAFEGAFVARYYRGAEPDEMVKVKSRPSGWWHQRLTDGVRNSANRCCVVWRGTPRKPVAFITFAEPLLVDATPTLSYAEAVACAVKTAQAWPGVEGAEGGAELRLWDPPFRHDAVVVSDDLGVQRLCYSVPLALTWREGGEGLESRPQGAPDPTPAQEGVEVDAHTGDCFTPFSRAVWPPVATQDRLATALNGKGLMLVFESRLVGDHPYVCARYLDSLIWRCTYRLDAEAGEVEVEYRGRTWGGAIGGNELVGGPRPISSGDPIRVIEHEAYLPIEMIEALTGWQASIRGDPLVGRLVDIVTPEAEREERSPVSVAAAPHETCGSTDAPRK